MRQEAPSARGRVILKTELQFRIQAFGTKETQWFFDAIQELIEQLEPLGVIRVVHR